MKDKENHQILATLSTLITASLFLAAYSIISISNIAVYAQPSNEAPFKGNVSGAIVSEQGGEDGAKGKAGSSNNASGSSASSYKPAYPNERADERKPFTVHTEKHLYKPGEEVKVEGSIWSGLIDQIGVGSMELNVTDNKGNVTVDKKDVLFSNSGNFSATFTLPQNAELGSYSINALIKLDANVLDTLQADVKSKLATSGRFEVISPNAFAVKAEGKSFELDIASNSTVTNPELNQDEKKLSFHVEGQNGTSGVTQITIPKALLSGQLTVSIDGKVVPPESSDVVTIADTEEGTTLEINYHHSEHTIAISGTSVVPEFPLSMIVMTAAIGSVIAAATIMARKRHPLT